MSRLFPPPRIVCQTPRLGDSKMDSRRPGHGGECSRPPDGLVVHPDGDTATQLGPDWEPSWRRWRERTLDFAASRPSTWMHGWSWPKPTVGLLRRPDPCGDCIRSREGSPPGARDGGRRPASAVECRGRRGPPASAVVYVGHPMARPIVVQNAGSLVHVPTVGRRQASSGVGPPIDRRENRWPSEQ